MYHFHAKLGSPLSKIDAFDIKLIIFHIETRAFRIAQGLSEKVRIIFSSRKI